MSALTTPVAALNPATLPARLTVSEQWGEPGHAYSQDSPNNWLLLAADFHGFDVVRHVELAKIRYALAWRERDLCAFEILVFIGMDCGVGTDDDTLDVIGPILTLKILHGRKLLRTLDFDMRIIRIMVIVFENLDPTILIDHLDFHIRIRCLDRQGSDGDHSTHDEQFEHQHGYLPFEKRDSDLWLKPCDRERMAFG